MTCPGFSPKNQAATVEYCKAIEKMPNDCLRDVAIFEKEPRREDSAFWFFFDLDVVFFIFYRHQSRRAEFGRAQWIQTGL